MADLDENPAREDWERALRLARRGDPHYLAKLIAHHSPPEALRLEIQRVLAAPVRRPKGEGGSPSKLSAVDEQWAILRFAELVSNGLSSHYGVPANFSSKGRKPEDAAETVAGEFGIHPKTVTRIIKKKAPGLWVDGTKRER
jgi:hypothetical protein